MRALPNPVSRARPVPPRAADRFRSRAVRAVVGVAFLTWPLTLLAAPDSARATILIFDQAWNGVSVIPTGSGSDYSNDYGDNVTGAAMAAPGGTFTYGEAGEGFTPDITVDITSSLASTGDPGVRLWNDNYGDLQNVLFSEGPGTAGAPLIFVRLTAAPGFVVDLYGFDLAHFSPVGTTIAGVSVMDGATTLFSAASVLVAGSNATPGRTSFSFETPLSAVELLLQIDLSNLSPGAQDNIGLDNVRFGQTPPGIVPEPGTAVLVFLGLAGLAARRRRVRSDG